MSAEKETIELVHPFIREPQTNPNNRKPPKWGCGVFCLQLITLLALLTLLVLFVLKSQTTTDVTQKQLNKKPETETETGTAVPMTAYKMEGMAGLKEFFEAKMQPHLDPCQDFYEFACGKHKQNESKGKFSAFEGLPEIARQLDLLKVDTYHLKAYSYLKAMASAFLNKTEPSEDDKNKIFEEVDEYLQMFGGTPLKTRFRTTRLNVFKTAFQLMENFGWRNFFLAIKTDLVKRASPPRHLALFIEINGNFLERNLTFNYSEQYLKKRGFQRSRSFHGKKIPTERLEEMANCEQNVYGEDLEWRNIKPMYYEHLRKCCPNLANPLSNRMDHIKGKEIFFMLRYNDKTCFLHSEDTKELYEMVNRNRKTIQALIMESFIEGMLTSLDHTQQAEMAKHFFLRTDTMLNYATLHLLLNHFEFKEENLVKISEIIEQVRLAFKERIQEVTWMDPMTKIQAINKLNHITPKFVAPPMVFDDEKFFRYYQDLPKLGGSESKLNLSTLIRRQTFSKLFQKLGNGSQPVATEFPMESAFHRNAFYHTHDNSITLFLAHFHPPNFSWNYPNYFIYATLSRLIGHELGHGFAPEGIKFDAEGNQRQWFTNGNLEEFKSRAKCYIDQYSSFTKKDPKNEDNTVPINGTETVSETISDDIGLKVAYSAFKNTQVVKERENATKYTNFQEMNEEQLFFLSFATSKCHSVGSGKNHPPARVRVLGTLRNNKQFQKAFQCEENSGMNPKKKCNMY